MGSDVSAHPWVINGGVVAAIIALIAVTAPKVWVAMGPVWRWLAGLKAARIQRRIEIEAAARILNDQRVVYLSEQLAGVAAQLDAVLAEQRRESARYQADIADLRRELAELRAAAAK